MIDNAVVRMLVGQRYSEHRDDIARANAADVDEHGLAAATEELEARHAAICDGAT